MEYLPSVHKALGLIPNTEMRRKKQTNMYGVYNCSARKAKEQGWWV